VDVQECPAADLAILLAIVSLGMYGVVYFGMAAAFRVPEVEGLIDKVTGFIGFHRARGKGAEKK
jgi:hypothetical protein